jgi:hypothetical protein
MQPSPVPPKFPQGQVLALPSPKQKACCVMSESERFGSLEAGRYHKLRRGGGR